MTEVDCVIIGAGMAGASLAAELATQRRIVLLEAERQPGYHATGRSAAFYLQAYGNAVVRALTTGSLGFFETPPAGFSAQPLLLPRGSLFIARAGQHDELLEHYRGSAALVPKLVLEDGAFAERLVPILRPGQVEACVWEPQARRIDVDAMLQGFLRIFKSAGGRIVTAAPVQSLDYRRGQWCAATAQGTVRAPVVVNAAGAWADEVAQLAGVRAIGLQPMRRTACIIEAPAGFDIESWPAVADVGEQFYFIPESGRLLLSPADQTPHAPGDVYPDDLDVAMAVDRFEAVTTVTVERVLRQWAGLRTFAPDRSPVVGFADDPPGFFWLAGQGGYGIQTAPAISRAAAALLRERELPADLLELGLSSIQLGPARRHVEA